MSPTLIRIKKAELHCASCGLEAPRRKFRSTGIENVSHPAGFASAYTTMGLSYADCASYPDRRSIHGSLIGAVGLTAGSDGGGVSLYFEKNVLVACIGTMANAGCIPIADLTEVSVRSRSDFSEDVTSSEHSEIARSLTATAVTALRYREPTSTETLVTVTWDDGGIVVLNQMLPSPVAVERFKPVLDRAFKARGNTQESIVDQIALLAMFQDSGLLSQDEFDSAAARALHKDRTE